MNQFTKLSTVAFLLAVASAQAQVRIGFIDPGLPMGLARHNAAAWAFAGSGRRALPLAPDRCRRLAGCQRPASRARGVRRDLVSPGRRSDRRDRRRGGNDLKCYLESGGVLLLFGSGGTAAERIEHRAVAVAGAWARPVCRVRERNSRGREIPRPSRFCRLRHGAASPPDHHRRQRVGRFLRHSRYRTAVAGRRQRGTGRAAAGRVRGRRRPR